MTLSKLTTADKKRITQDWNELFPSLGVYKPMHLINRIGPILVGILLEVKSWNNSYIPTFHVHNLVRPFPVITLGLASTLNRQSVSLEFHEKKHRELAKIMSKNLLIPLEGDVELDKVLSGFKKYIENPTFPFQIEVYEYMILVSAWCGNTVEVQKAIDLAKKETYNWPEHVFARIGGVESWLNKLKEEASDSEKLKKICENQVIELKVDKLPSRNILY